MSWQVSVSFIVGFLSGVIPTVVIFMRAIKSHMRSR